MIDDNNTKLIKKQKEELVKLKSAFDKLNYLTDEDRILETVFINGERLITEKRLKEIGISGWSLPFGGRVAYNRYISAPLPRMR